MADDFIAFNGAPIHYRTLGSGPWVVLLHGFLESIAIWDAMAASLESSFSVLMIDLPGHGRSGMVNEIHSMPLMAGSVAAVTSHLGIQSFMVCGHSMGGYVALQLSSLMPEMVKGIVLLHSHAAPDDDVARQNRQRTIEIVQNDRHHFIHQFIPDLFAAENLDRLSSEIENLKNQAAATSGKAIIAALNGMMDRTGWLDFLMETKLPLLFVIGKDDSRMPYNKLLAQAMLPSHSEILLLSKVGHMGFLEAPEKIFPVIHDFFKRNLPGV